MTRGRRAGHPLPRLALLLAVFAGLFLMHGMSASAGNGCHSGASPMAAMESSTASPMAGAADSPIPIPMPIAMAMSGHGSEHATTGDSVTRADAAEHLASGETCIPLRPDGVVLALSAFVVWWMTDHGVRSVAIALRRWPHGPPRRGADLLNELRVCRT